MIEPADPRLVVGGCMRSGTTLLRNMLAAHPNLAVPDESQFVVVVYARLAAEGRTQDLRRAWELIRRHPRFIAWELDEREVEQTAAEHPPRSYPDLVRVLFTTFARSQGKAWSGDKNPENARHFRLLSEMLPTSRFVHVLRDPRAVCMSLAVQPWFEGGLVKAARAWRTFVQRARDSSAVLGERYTEVRYEELVAEPERELGRLCSLGGIPFDPAMLRYGRSRSLLAAGHHASSRESLRGEVRPWHQEMDDDDVSVVELVVGEVMDLAGYPRVRRRPTLRARREVAAWQLTDLFEQRVEHRWGPPKYQIPARLSPETGPFVPFLS